MPTLGPNPPARLWLGCVSALALLTTVACGDPDNAIEGSITEVLTLEFDEVEVSKQGLSLVIDYVKKEGGSDLKVLSILVQTGGLDLQDDSLIEGDLFHEVIEFQRLTRTGEEFPDVVNGRLHFDKFGLAPGAKVDGDTEVGFVNGRTMVAYFDGKVEDRTP